MGKSDSSSAKSSRSTLNEVVAIQRNGSENTTDPTASMA